jgi:hypothetical protein
MSQINPIHTLSPSFLKIQYNIIFHILLALPSGVFQLGFPTKILFAFLSSLIIHAIYAAHLKETVNEVWKIFFDSPDVSSVLKRSTRLFHLFAWFPVRCAAREVIG